MIELHQAQNRHIDMKINHYREIRREKARKNLLRPDRDSNLALLNFCGKGRFWLQFSGISSALVKWLSSRTSAQGPRAVTFLGPGVNEA